MTGESSIMKHERMLKEFKRIYRDYSSEIVMIRLNISRRKFNQLLHKTLADNLNSDFSATMSKIPLSSNEDNYGSRKDSKHIVTKDGLFVFKNSPILYQYETKLAKAVRLYKQALNLNYERSV